MSGITVYYFTTAREHETVSQLAQRLEVAVERLQYSDGEDVEADVQPQKRLMIVPFRQEDVAHDKAPRMLWFGAHRDAILTSMGKALGSTQNPVLLSGSRALWEFAVDKGLVQFEAHPQGFVLTTHDGIGAIDCPTADETKRNSLDFVTRLAKTLQMARSS